MSVLLAAATVLLVFVATVVVGDLVSDEVRGRLDQLPFALLRLAARRLPTPMQADRYREWAGELHEVLRGMESVPVTRLWRGVRYASGLLLVAPRLGRELGSGSPAIVAARNWLLLGQAAWLNANRTEAIGCLRQALVLFQAVPDCADKVDAYAELGRLHMLNYECRPAIAAAVPAATIAGRLGLSEARAHAWITIATARFESGDAGGLADLQEITEHCRANRLLALRRAARNLAHLVREEGDWQRSEQLLAESDRQAPAADNRVLLDQSGHRCAYFIGDLDALDVPDLAMESGWERRLELRAWVRALRGDPGGAAADATAALAAARTAGFHRPRWAALATAALCRALQRQHDEAAELLAELIEEWRKVSVLPSWEWVCRAAQAAALTGPDAAEAQRALLAELPRRTAWSQAALLTVTGAVALGQGAPGAAAEHHLAAAEALGRMPAVVDRMLSLALAGAADPYRAAPMMDEVRAFAQLRRTPVLLQISTDTTPPRQGSSPNELGSP